MYREALWPIVHGVAKESHNLTTKQQVWAHFYMTIWKEFKHDASMIILQR